MLFKKNQYFHINPSRIKLTSQTKSIFKSQVEIIFLKKLIFLFKINFFMFLDYFNLLLSKIFF
jgi:hypothetical protein